MEATVEDLKKEFPKLSFERHESASYVKIFTKTSSEVILVYIKNRPSIISNTYKCNKNNEQDDLELTGSPLKLDLSLHTILDETLPPDEAQMWTKDECFHGPISLKQAREIANIYNHSLKMNATESDCVPMWLLTSPNDEQRTLLLMVQSYKDYFCRGLVTYVDTMCFLDIDVESLVEEYAKEENINDNMVNTEIDCKYNISGMSYGSSFPAEELTNTLHNGNSELYCEWTGTNIHTPVMSCKVNFEQEIIVGHILSPCNSLWSSVCALHNINQLIVDMTVTGVSSINLANSGIRRTNNSRSQSTSKRLTTLLNEVETYAYMAECPPGGCICVSEDTNSLKSVFDLMNKTGSSNDFTYKLWDILKDAENAEDLISMLINALKFISSGKIRPFIDANNKTYLSKLLLKLSRGHSQTSKVLKNLKTNPQQALSMVAQVGIEKTQWEYTHLMSLIEHSFYVAGIWSSDVRSHESIEQINQTIAEMTLNGDFSLNPFETFTNSDHSIRLDCSSYEDDPNELTVDDFASIKKLGGSNSNDKRPTNEVPLIADEIDISPWKNILMKFAQVHVCLEHLYRAEVCLRADFTSLKPIASKLLEQYVSDRSPIKTVGQLINDPLQKISIPITNNIVKDHLKKPVYWYRVTLNKKEDCNMGLKREAKVVYLFTQQPIFPPSVWQHIEPQSDEVVETTAIGEELKYYCTKYTYLKNKLPNAFPL